jgi:hypothetical protein
MPPGLNGELVSKGIAFLFTVMPARSSVFLRFFAVKILRPQIDEHEVIVGAAGDDAVTVFGDPGGECFGVNHHLALIIAELRLERFMETDRFGGDDVHKRPALNPRENHRVDCFRECSAVHIVMPPRGPRRLLCVVVVTNERAERDSDAPPATSPAMCAMSTKRNAPTESAIWRSRGNR